MNFGAGHMILQLEIVFVAGALNWVFLSTIIEDIFRGRKLELLILCTDKGLLKSVSFFLCCTILSEDVVWWHQHGTSDCATSFGDSISDKCYIYTCWCDWRAKDTGLPVSVRTYCALDCTNQCQYEGAIATFYRSERKRAITGVLCTRVVYGTPRLGWLFRFQLRHFSLKRTRKTNKVFLQFIPNHSRLIMSHFAYNFTRESCKLLSHIAQFDVRKLRGAVDERPDGLGI